MGEVIAALNLGSKAGIVHLLRFIVVIKFRPIKSKSVRAAEIAAAQVDVPFEEEFDEIVVSIQPGAPPALCQFPRRRRKLSNRSREVLRVNFHHGDILIQQGAGLQKFYEVHPTIAIIDKACCRTRRNENRCDRTIY